MGNLNCTSLASFAAFAMAKEKSRSLYEKNHGIRFDEFMTHAIAEMFDVRPKQTTAVTTGVPVADTMAAMKQLRVCRVSGEQAVGPAYRWSLLKKLGHLYTKQMHVIYIYIYID